METLKELAARHNVNATSLRIWLTSEAHIAPTVQEIVKGNTINKYNQEAAAAVAAFLEGRPKRSVGRPPKPTAGAKSK